MERRLVTVSVKFPMNEIVASVRNVQGKLEKDRANLLKILGTQLLSYAQQDFQTKGRGGRGSDGQAWKPLAASTIKAKARRGKGNAKRKKTKGGKKRPVGDATQIGVDTGLLRASARPGYRGADNNGGNVFDIRGVQVTVGYGRNYAKYFDEKRPLFPKVIPQGWQEALDKRTEEWADKIAKEVFGVR